MHLKSNKKHSAFRVWLHSKQGSGENEMYVYYSTLAPKEESYFRDFECVKKYK